jgi:hypothetical protein
MNLMPNGMPTVDADGNPVVRNMPEPVDGRASDGGMDKNKNIGDGASAVTPEMDAAYLAAVEKGDLDGAQGILRGLLSKLGFDVGWFHGSGKDDLLRLEPEKQSRGSFPGIFASDTKAVAEMVASTGGITDLARAKALKAEFKKKNKELGRKHKTYEVAVRIQNPVEFMSDLFLKVYSETFGITEKQVIGKLLDSATEHNAAIETGMDEGIKIQIPISDQRFREILEEMGYQPEDISYEFMQSYLTRSTTNDEFASDASDAAEQVVFEKKEDFIQALADSGGFAFGETEALEGNKPLQFLGSLQRDVLDNYIKSGGFDGVIYEDMETAIVEKGSETAIVFDSRNIVIADTILRDSSGNIIPLSKRFNQSPP